MSQDKNALPQVEPVNRHTSLAQMAYESIRAAILSGRIKPGERLGQAELARDLGVSQRTVREAIARLSAKGLAAHEPFKGVRVVALPLEDLRQVYNLRALLEGQAMQLAAAHITAEEIERMKALLPLTVAKRSGSDMETAQHANHDFHWVAIRASRSGILERLLEQLWEMMFAYELLYQDGADSLNTSVTDMAQHEALVAALEARDGEQAARVNTENIISTMNTLLARLQDRRPVE